MKIITAGSEYIDIDAYGSCIAYAELLNLMGIPAQAVSSAVKNQSIPTIIKSWHPPITDSYNNSKGDTYILVDVSDPKYFDKIVDINRVEEVVDHHPGLEEYWKNIIGNKTDIQFIGSACTLVYEKWLNSGLVNKMSELSARLLICGILDNTLNFRAKITTNRDISAHDSLLRIANLPKDWTKQYFSDCQNAILQDSVFAIENDTKTLSFKSFPETVRVGQLVVWDAKSIIKDHQAALANAIRSKNINWFINIISINDDKSYFITDNESLKTWLTKLLKVKFYGSTAVADRLWLRKEIMKRDLESI